MKKFIADVRSIWAWTLFAYAMGGGFRWPWSKR